MKRLLRTIVFCGIAVLIMTLAPRSADANHQPDGPAATAACTALPSCAPKDEWICIFGNETRYDMCDTESPGCLDPD